MIQLVFVKLAPRPVWIAQVLLQLNVLLVRVSRLDRLMVLVNAMMDINSTSAVEHVILFLAVIIPVNSASLLVTLELVSHVNQMLLFHGSIHVSAK